VLSLKEERLCILCGKPMYFIREWKHAPLLDKMFFKFNTAYGLKDKFVCACGFITYRSYNTQDHLEISPKELKKIYKRNYKGDYHGRRKKK